MELLEKESYLVHEGLFNDFCSLHIIPYRKSLNLGLRECVPVVIGTNSVSYYSFLSNKQNIVERRLFNGPFCILSGILGNYNVPKNTDLRWDVDANYESTKELLEFIKYTEDTDLCIWAYIFHEYKFMKQELNEMYQG